MSTVQTSTPPASGATGDTRLWFGLLGGAAAWTAHLMLCYAVGEFGCLSPVGHEVYAGFTVVTWTLLAVSAATFALALAATAAALGSGARLLGDHVPESDREAKRYVARAGAILSGIFTFVILVESVPILYHLGGC